MHEPIGVALPFHVRRFGVSMSQVDTSLESALAELLGLHVSCATPDESHLPVQEADRFGFVDHEGRAVTDGIGAASAYGEAPHATAPIRNALAPPPRPRAKGGGGAVSHNRRQAKRFGRTEIDLVKNWIKANSYAPESDTVVVLMAYYAGGRAADIANMRAQTLLDCTGKVLYEIIFMPGTTKSARERRVPMHPELRHALTELFSIFPDAERIAYRRDKKGLIHYRSASSLTQWFKKVYARVGLRGCTGMSGRRSFATSLWRAAAQTGASITDVQALLGHASLRTTQYYLDPTNDHRALIQRL